MKTKVSMMMIGVLLIVFTSVAASASGALGAAEMGMLQGGSSNGCRTWECGGPTHSCTPVPRGMACDDSDPDTDCTGTHVTPVDKPTCNGNHPPWPLCNDGPKTYCGKTNGCDCNAFNICVAPDSLYIGTSGWYNPCN